MNVKIKAETREIGKKSDLNELRRKGMIPGIIYGEGKEGLKIALEKISFHKEYKKNIGELVFYQIQAGGKSYKTIIKERQFHPVSQELLHIDFLELHKGKPITLNMPLKFIGEAKGVEEGGLLEILVRELEISCLPKDIPEDIIIDVASLEIGDSIHLRQIDLGGIETKMADDTTLVAVRAPKQFEEEEKEEVEEGEEGEETEEETEEESDTKER